MTTVLAKDLKVGYKYKLANQDRIKVPMRIYTERLLDRPHELLEKTSFGQGALKLKFKTDFRGRWRFDTPLCYVYEDQEFILEAPPAISSSIAPIPVIEGGSKSKFVRKIYTKKNRRNHKRNSTNKRR